MHRLMSMINLANLLTFFVSRFVLLFLTWTLTIVNLDGRGEPLPFANARFMN
jgi:hypothetical protein